MRRNPNLDVSQVPLVGFERNFLSGAIAFNLCFPELPAIGHKIMHSLHRRQCSLLFEAAMDPYDNILILDDLR